MKLNESLYRAMTYWFWLAIAIIAALTFLAAVVLGQTTVRGKTGVPLVVESNTPVKWKSLDPALELKEANGTWAIVYSKTKGEWLLLAYTAKGGQLETARYFRVEVKEGDSFPVPPNPEPPSDFSAKLKETFEADGGGAAEKKRFIKFYSTAAKLVKSYDPAVVKTSGQLLLALRGMAKDSYWPDDSLMPKTRALCFDRLALDVDLSPQAKLAEAVLQRWSNALAAIAAAFERMK